MDRTTFIVKKINAIATVIRPADESYRTLEWCKKSREFSVKLGQVGAVGQVAPCVWLRPRCSPKTAFRSPSTDSGPRSSYLRSPASVGRVISTDRSAGKFKDSFVHSVHSKYHTNTNLKVKAEQQQSVICSFIQTKVLSIFIRIHIRALFRYSHDLFSATGPNKKNLHFSFRRPNFAKRAGMPSGDPHYPTLTPSSAVFSRRHSNLEFTPDGPPTCSVEPDYANCYNRYANPYQQYQRYLNKNWTLSKKN